MFLLLACSKEKPAETVDQTSPQKGEVSYSIEITPFNVTRNSTVYLVPNGFAVSDAKIDWLVNGKSASASMPDQLNTNETRKHDTVQARAIINGKEILSNTVQIKNSPPEISKVKILPEVFKPGDTLSIETSGSDTDGDGVSISYEWTRNGSPAGNGPHIEGPVKRGDKISIKITPFDGEDYGRAVVLQREMVNMPPMIIEDKKYTFNGNIYTYQVNATDADGDTLTYILKKAPPGMTINPSTGLIKWNVPPDFKGRSQFIVAVTDGHGGEVTQSFTLEITPDKK
ncbi:MAG: putative Ig domain-containing protein [Thermodesulfovibrionales bacterium]